MYIKDDKNRGEKRMKIEELKTDKVLCFIVGCCDRNNATKLFRYNN